MLGEHGFDGAPLLFGPGRPRRPIRRVAPGSRLGNCMAEGFQHLGSAVRGRATDTCLDGQIHNRQPAISHAGHP